MFDWRDFVTGAAAAFLGTGAAIAVLRWIVDTSVGNWLAKGLARYKAAIDTIEHERRVKFDRLDADRSAFIRKYFADAARCQRLFVEPVDEGEIPVGASPEIAYLRLYGRITSLLGEMAEDIAANAHMFSPDESLQPMMFGWQMEAHAAADRYLDWLQAQIANSEFMQLEMVDRRRQLMYGKQAALIAPKEAFQRILARGRQLTTGEP